MNSFITVSPDQLAEINEIPEDLRAVVFSPTGPLQSVPHERLLSKLIATDLCKASKALLDADLAHAADSVALVFSDPTAVLNGWYRKLGASGAGSWQQFEELSRNARNVALAAATAAEQARDVTQTARLAAVKARDDAQAARDVTIAAASDVDGIEFPRFSTVAALLADTLITSGVTGRTWLGGGVSFTEAAGAATDHHVTTAGGIKLYVVPSYGYAKPIYEAAAFGITPALTGTALADRVTGALAKIPPFTALRLGAGHYLPGPVTSGAVLPDASGSLGAFFLDKPGQELIGVGYDTHIDGGELGMSLVNCRASYIRVRKMRIGNVEGPEGAGIEATGVLIAPTNYPRINPMGADIEDIQVDDVDFYKCENFVSAIPEAWGTLAEATTNATTTDRFTAFYKAKKIKVTNCRGVDTYRTAVELFQADDSEVTSCYFTKGEVSGATGQAIAPLIRAIGSRRVKVTGNTLVNRATLADGQRAVEMSLSGYFGVSPQSTISADFVVSANHFFNYPNCVEVSSSLGFANIFGNNAYLPDGLAEARFVHFVTSGVNPFDLRLKSKAGVAKVHGNNVVGGTHLVKVTGAVDELEILDNTYIGGDVADAFLLQVALNNDSNPDVTALERIPIAVVKGNTCITKPNANIAPISLGQMKAGDLVYIDDNRITPSAAGRIIQAGTGINSGTVITQSLTSNERLPSTEWAARYDPMASTLAERRLVP